MIELVEDPNHLLREGTRSVNRIPGLAGEVRIGTADASLTSACGVVAVAELVGWLGVIGALDDSLLPRTPVRALAALTCHRRRCPRHNTNQAV
jgi:hypothetical protein